MSWDPWNRRSVIAIIGRAPNWKHDLDLLKSMAGEVDILAVGKGCPYNGHVDFFATYHTNEISIYKKQREQAGLNTDFIVVSHVEEKGVPVDLIFPYEKPSGSSALLGVFAAINSGYKKIVLCGCPLEGVNEKKYSYETFKQGWIKHKAELGDKVRSMSGWTEIFLGGVTLEWLKGEKV